MISAPAVPVSWGELLDKISILELKRERLRSGPALANVTREHDLLCRSAQGIIDMPSVEALYVRLRRINATLWDVEDALRDQEAQASFGPPFVALARSVYQTNDARAAVKREINLLLECDLVEEKSYASSGLVADCAVPTSLAPMSAAPDLIATAAG